MSHESDEERTSLHVVLLRVRPSLASWRLTIEALTDRGELPSKRHVLGVAEQAATYASAPTDVSSSGLFRAR